MSTSGVATKPRESHTSVLCWTRMQAEAGQNLDAIIQRKELERKTGKGVFFWGIGNAPNRNIGNLAKSNEDVDVVFSKMKSRPKKRDASPSGLLVWQSYLDTDGTEHPLPEHVLVTSKLSVGKQTKSVHYALVCKSRKRLCLKDFGPFDPTAYRNVSKSKRPVGASQVTALVSRKSKEAADGAYRVNLKAKLTSSFWVRLCQPSVLQLETSLDNLVDEIKSEDWVNLVAKIRGKVKSTMKKQNTLF